MKRPSSGIHRQQKVCRTTQQEQPSGSRVQTVFTDDDEFYFFFPYGTLTCNVINLTGSGERNVLLQNIKMIILTFLTTDFDFISKIKKKKTTKKTKKPKQILCTFQQKSTRLPCPVGGGDLMPVLRVLGQGAHMATHDLRLLSAAGADCDFFCSF